MEVKTTVVWWLVNDQLHPSLAERDMHIDALMPLIDTMFPGINYFSVTGFNQVMRQCVLPALRRRHGNLRGMPVWQVRADDTTEVAVVLPSQGYEWQREDWQAKLARLLAT